MYYSRLFFQIILFSKYSNTILSHFLIYMDGRHNFTMISHDLMENISTLIYSNDIMNYVLILKMIYNYIKEKWRYNIIWHSHRWRRCLSMLHFSKIFLLKPWDLLTWRDRPKKGQLKASPNQENHWAIDKFIEIKGKQAMDIFTKISTKHATINF